MEIQIFGDIGTGDREISAAYVATKLAGAKKGQAVTVTINSCGGDVFEALAIYNLLNERCCTTHVVGAAISAASLIAMAGTPCKMAKNSLMMIHNAWTVTGGSKEEHAKTIVALERVDQVLCDTYAAKTGLSKAKIKSMMAAETWLTAQECYDLEFCDALTGDYAAAASFDSRLYGYRNVPNWAARYDKSPTAELRQRIALERKALTT